MKHSFTAYLRYIRKRINRGRWLSSALNMPVFENIGDSPGLIIIQVDGLSRHRMEQGMAKGRLPFLRRLIRHENYRLHTHYSGLPSSTPAVQAEVFYGIKTTVPAFAFFNRESGKVERMFEPDTAARVEEQLIQHGSSGLLAGGSSYSNNFTGGAATNEAHFCASSLGFRDVLTAFRPFGLITTIAVNLVSILRLFGLLAVEFLLAFWDFFHGIYHGRSFLRELKFVPTRIAISVTLREICVMGAKMDIHRGLPIIHMNFLGYDEQSHRRGPDSKFAQWTLKGIDYAIERVWRDAARAERRYYNVWIYSDHGQCTTTPYHKLTGYLLPEALKACLSCIETSESDLWYAPKRSTAVPGSYDTTADLVRRSPTCLCGAHQDNAHAESITQEKDEGVHTVGLGPVAFAYFSTAMTEDQLTTIAQMLVNNHQVPCVLMPSANGSVTAFTKNGVHALPQQTEAVCGAHHPFLTCYAEDLVRLCRHRDAGNLTLLGWCAGSQQITFAVENGSHGGIAEAETTAFALLPADAPIAGDNTQFIRPSDIRKAALAYLGQIKNRTPSTPRTMHEPPPATLRILTYNVHSCIGTDGKLSIDRIARLIAQHAPHIVALQEVDVGRFRTGGHDQARQIARRLEMAYYFHPSIHIEEEQYGNAILTHLPMRVIKAGALPNVGKKPREPRGALWTSINFNGQDIQVINAHLGLSPNERQHQVDCLMGKDWLGHPHNSSPMILCGDFNTLPNSRPMLDLKSRLRDVQHLLKGRPTLGTFPSVFPAARIDHILIDGGLSVNAVYVPRSFLARAASDHLPLIADLQLAVDH